MLFTMLFEDSERELQERTAQKRSLTVDGTTVRKTSMLYAVLYPTVAVLLIALGVLTLVLQPIPQYHATAICLFAAAVVPLFFLVDLLYFRVTVGNAKIAVQRLGAAKTVYAYTDVSWRFQTPDAKRSAVVLYCGTKQLARITPGARGYASLTALRHKGVMKENEKRLLRAVNAGKH